MYKFTPKNKWKKIRYLKKRGEQTQKKPKNKKQMKIRSARKRQNQRIKKEEEKKKFKHMVA